MKDNLLQDQFKSEQIQNGGLLDDLSNSIAAPVLMIKPSRGWIPLKLKELWEYRELVLFLAWRDILIRYKQAVLGASWAVIQPLMAMVIFTIIFGRLAKIPSDGIPYPVFTFAALLPWQLFASALQRAGSSLVGNAGLITKVYFPRLIVPLSAVIAGLVDFGISFVVLIGLMFYYGITPTLSVLLLPLLVILTLLTALSVSLWLSALNVLYRDVQHAIPFLVQAWLYASPVVYSASMVPSGKWQFIYGLNPMAGVIQGFRWTLFGGKPPSALLAASIIMVVVTFISGLYFFKRTERTFADIV